MGKGAESLRGADRLRSFALVEIMNPDYTKTSQQRTGTPPYMAYELLLEASPVHLYKHDLESLFYVMLLIAARHTIRTLEGDAKPQLAMRESRRLPFEDWFNEPRYHVLGSIKGIFLSKLQPIKLSSVFKDFLPWLEDLQQCFSNGFTPKPSRNNRAQKAWRAAVQPARFDDETLGGHITYATILTAVPHLSGELRGLVIRDPEYSPSTGAAKADK